MSIPLKIIKIRDVIYEEIKLTTLALAIIDTWIFQQTRSVKQLGFVYLVYPSANHTRFEHMIGTYHITKYWINHLKGIYPECISDEIAEWICIGGLCHDLGHGPFSHLFDDITETKHEIRSVKAVK